MKISSQPVSVCDGWSRSTLPAVSAVANGGTGKRSPHRATPGDPEAQTELEQATPASRTASPGSGRAGPPAGLASARSRKGPGGRVGKGNGSSMGPAHVAAATGQGGGAGPSGEPELPEPMERLRGALQAAERAGQELLDCKAALVLADKRRQQVRPRRPAAAAARGLTRRGPGAGGAGGAESAAAGGAGPAAGHAGAAGRGAGPGPRGRCRRPAAGGRGGGGRGERAAAGAAAGAAGAVGGARGGPGGARGPWPPQLLPQPPRLERGPRDRRSPRKKGSGSVHSVVVLTLQASGRQQPGGRW